MEEEGLDLEWEERQENACGIMSFGRLHSKMETRTQATLCFYVNTDIGEMKHSQSVTVNGVVLFNGEAVAAHPGTGTRGAELQMGALRRK